MPRIVLVFLLVLAPFSASADLTTRVSGIGSYFIPPVEPEVEGTFGYFYCGASGTGFAECSNYWITAWAWASYGGVALSTEFGPDPRLYYGGFEGESYAAFSDSIIVTAPSGGVLDLLWRYETWNTWTPATQFRVNGYEPPLICPVSGNACFGEYVQAVPFSPGLAVPIMASMTGPIWYYPHQHAPTGIIVLDEILVLDAGGNIIRGASLRAASGTHYRLGPRNMVPEPKQYVLLSTVGAIFWLTKRWRKRKLQQPGI